VLDAALADELRQAARLDEEGSFNTFRGDFNFGGQNEPDVRRSIHPAAAQLRTSGLTQHRAAAECSGCRTPTRRHGLTVGKVVRGSLVHRRVFSEDTAIPKPQLRADRVAVARCL
jgi:hypothetical protein